MFDVAQDISLAFQVHAKADKYPDLPVFTFENHGQPDEILTYGKLVMQGNYLAGFLKSAGIGPGDTFAVVMGNQPEVIVALYAALATGAVLLPLDPRSDWEKLVYLLRQCRAKGIVFSVDSAEAIEKVLSVLPEIRILGIKNADGAELFCDGETSSFVPGKREVGRHAMILHTSGTTGIPKGIRVRKRSLYRYLFMAEHLFQYKPDERLYTGLPMTHGNAFFLTIMPALFFGIPAVISRKFDPKRVWEICRTYRCTMFSLLGGLSADIYNVPERPDDAVNPVRKVISAGTPRHIWKDFQRRFNVAIHEWYGTLEGAVAHNPPGVGPVGSFGKPVQPFVEMKVIGENGSECSAGETGELLFRFQDGTSRVEYLEDTLASNETEQDGWIRTGDMVHQDQQGWLFFDYRKGQELRHHGEFIAADDVETVLLAHPEVRDACVYGIDTDSQAPGEQDLVAAIVPAGKGTPDINGIFVMCAHRLPAAAVPSYIQLIEFLPRTPTEKVIRRLIKERFEADSPYVYRFNDQRTRSSV